MGAPMHLPEYASANWQHVVVPIPHEVLQLIDRFSHRQAEYMSPEYMEARVRIDFLNPMFTALGWDVANKAGRSERHREVLTEGRVKTSAGIKFPDYIFQLGGKHIFPVEAKKPSVNVKNDPSPALQLRRYAWNSDTMGIGILTDFQEFSVYDLKIAPDGGDAATKARVDYYTFNEYPDAWDEIAGRFSKEAVLAGSLDEYAATLTGARGKQRVDKVFLGELEAWRARLAIEIAAKNGLSEPEINSAVQLIIDRIVFLRVAEDRGLEHYGDLRDAGTSRNAYENLQPLFIRADQKYNSGLFHLNPEKGRSRPDTLTPNLVIRDLALIPFIKSLYWPAGPYDFSLLPADVLGHVYEQFLGKVVHLQNPHKVVVEEKPEVRKAKGVYYTPSPVVSSIVAATLSPLLDKATPKRLEDRGLRVCDPSCGSGSFLIEVYQHLLDWHLDYYTKHSPVRWGGGKTPRIRNIEGQWRLTTSERKRILVAHVFGVDIDPQAVEVTKLSLLLKVLEGETDGSIYEQTALLHDRVLPDLGNNIKCGNSLIGNAIHFAHQTSLDTEFDKRVNAFDWDIEFPIVARGRGFDAIVGNPPWLMAGYYVSDSVEYLKEHFVTATGKFDLYYLFLEQVLRLLSPSGRFGMIVPNKMFHTRAAKALRSLLATACRLELVQDFGTEKVFAGATNYSCVLMGSKDHPGRTVAYERLLADLTVQEHFEVKQELLTSGNWNFQDAAATAFFAKLANRFPTLDSLVLRFGTGLQTGSDKLLTLTPSEAKSRGLEDEVVTKLIRGRDIHAYSLDAMSAKVAVFPYARHGSQFRLLTQNQLKQYPNAWRYLSERKTQLASRIWFGKSAEALSGAWYGHMYVEQLQYLGLPHLLTPSLSKDCNFAIGSGDLFATGTAGVTSVIPKPSDIALEYFLGVLNSSITRVWLHAHSPIFQGGFHKFSAPYLKQIPIAIPDTSTKEGRAQHERVVNAVKRTADCVYRLRGARSDGEHERAQRQLAVAKRLVDEAVAAVYELSSDDRDWLAMRV